MASRAITKTELLEMLDSYGIGKKPLARLLGWGETTVLLYAEEDTMPDNELTRRLHELACDPVGYAWLLCSNRDRITDVAYRKSLTAVGQLMPMTKLLRCVDFIVNETRMEEHAEMSLLRVETILFWSQVISLCFMGVPLFEDVFRPDDRGMPYSAPVERLKRTGRLALSLPPECLQRMSEAEKEAAKHRKEENGSSSFRLSLADKEILFFTTNIFAWYGYDALERLMEAEHYRLCGPAGARRRKSVTDETIRKCYSEVFGQNKVNKIKDVDTFIQRRINYIRKQK